MVHSPADRRRAKRIRDIADAALELVVERGLDGLTMKVLADRVDLTAGALYRYFPGRDAIIVAMVGVVVAELEGAMARVHERAAHESPLVLPVALAATYRGWAAARPRHARLLAQLLGTPDLQVSTDAASPAVPGALALVGRLAASLAAAAAAGDLESGDALGRAVVLWAALDGVLSRRKLLAHAPGLVDVDALAHAAVSTLLRGWGAEPAAVTDAARAASTLLEPPPWEAP